MRLGVPAEARREEQRVAVTPETVSAYVALGYDVVVEAGAGAGARIADAAYVAAGAALVDRDTVWSSSDLIVKVAQPLVREVDALKEGATVLFWLDGDETQPVVKRLAAKGATLLAMDAVPRITRAQVMDVRSSMANLAGYRAVVEAASRFGRTLGAQVTAAGSTPPAQILVIGAGVAGLAALAAGRGLGAQVSAFDTRSACREQVESLGGAFLEVQLDESGEGSGGYAKEMSQAFLDAEMALFRRLASETDIVITTAAIPNRPAPKLWMADAVAEMKAGSVVVDLAAARGGNCEHTVPGKVVEVDGVTIVGTPDLTQAMADHASRLLARNVLALLRSFGGAEDFTVDLDDPVVRGVTVLHAGEVLWPAPPPEPSPPPPPAEPAPPPPAAAAPTAAADLPPTDDLASRSPVWLGAGALGLAATLLLAPMLPAAFLHHLTVFVLACVVGWQVVWNVTPALHTPLMSVTNAISGIILVGGLLQLGAGSDAAIVLGFLAVVFASINVFGGFAVTHRMLDMFRGEA